MINTRTLASLSLSALMLGGSMVGCAGGGKSGLASAGERNAAAVAQQAADEAVHAQSALAKRHADDAVRFAEAAVQLAPKQASYRVLLGQSYLKAGRFVAATQALNDALQLQPDSGTAALNLALAQTGLGKWNEARKTLTAHATTIAAGDLGLALAVSGDAQEAIDVLTEVARSPQSTPKVRQNLGLALALAGRWQEARAVAAMDLDPAAVDERLGQWAAFAQPNTASDQVAALLGVVPVSDQGQPTALALVAAVSPAAAVLTEEAPVARAPAIVPAASFSAGPDLSLATKNVIMPRMALVRDREEAKVMVRKPVKAPALKSAPAPAKRVTAAVPTAKGGWFVQLGAYQSAAVAKDGWARATRRFTAFKGHTPNGMDFALKNNNFYRLSVGGFDRSEAIALCRRYKAKGGQCFVRQSGGDQLAQWLKKSDVRYAAKVVASRKG